MSEYKILVRSVEEVEKAQTLFEKLGFRKGECTLYDLPKLVAAQHDPLLGTYSSGASLNFDSKNKYEWLSMEQLEDLVKGLNDLEDAELVAKCKSNEQGLISGADALRALADGEEIQWISKDFKKWNNLDEWNANLKTFLNEKYIAESEFKFRLKPRTVKLEIEVPAPFEPKIGEEYYYLNSGRESGYAMKLHDGKQMDFIAIQYGAWRTEAEIKIVVEQLRKLKRY